MKKSSVRFTNYYGEIKRYPIDVSNTKIHTCSWFNDRINRCKMNSLLTIKEDLHMWFLNIFRSSLPLTCTSPP